MDVCPRWLTPRELNCCDSQAPDISFPVVPGLLYDLWGHPEGGADEGVAERFDGGELRGDAEVGKLDAAAGGEEDVGGFDVPVEFGGGVEVGEAVKEFAHDDGNVHLVDGAGFELQF